MSRNLLRIFSRHVTPRDKTFLFSRSLQHKLFKLVRLNLHQAVPALSQSSHSLTNQQVHIKRNKMFEEESKRQTNLIPRIEKIEVIYEEDGDGAPEGTTLILNKGLSTPFNVAQHISEMLVDRSALALVNGQLWDMNRPLEEDCSIKLLHFHQKDPFHVNRAFWRSCSFLLGVVLESVFKNNVFVELHSFPAAHVSSGCFVHDVDLKLNHDWNPSREELLVFSAAMHRIAEKALKFERLVVDANLALKMFSENQYKTLHIPSIAAKSTGGNSVTLYRVGDHVDISIGPMVGDSSFLGRRCSIPVAHHIYHNDVPMYRFQGVALPKGIYLNHVAFGILEKRAMRLNMANLQSTRVVSPA